MKAFFSSFYVTSGRPGSIWFRLVIGTYVSVAVLCLIVLDFNINDLIRSAKAGKNPNAVAISITILARDILVWGTISVIALWITITALLANGPANMADKIRPFLKNSFGLYVGWFYFYWLPVLLVSMLATKMLDEYHRFESPGWYLGMVLIVVIWACLYPEIILDKRKRKHAKKLAHEGAK